MKTEAREARETRLIIVLGYNGTGKTTLVKELLAAELRKPAGRGLIVTPDDIEWRTLPDVHHKHKHHIATYKGARRLIYQDGVLELIVEHYRNGLLVLDDCRAYLTASTGMDLHNLIIRRRQKMIDIVAVGHGFTEVPPKLFTFASDIVLFRTKDNISKRKEVLKDFDLMLKAQEHVNARALENPHYYEIIPQV
ncbi:MAG: ATP-binding protein [Bacteroidales bacterium]|nr:ATP-binding protein [Bacteroidales bacterium]